MDGWMDAMALRKGGTNRKYTPKKVEKKHVHFTDMIT
jgi:hypothetical protein